MKKGKKFTYFDILIFIVIAAVIAGGLWYAVKKNKNVSPEKELEFTIEVTDKPSTYASGISEGDTVSISGGGTATVKSVTRQDARKFTKDTVNGEFKETVIPECYDYYITLTGDASENEKDIKIGETAIKTGSATVAEGSGYKISGHVVDMHYTDESEAK